MLDMLSKFKKAEEAVYDDYNIIEMFPTNRESKHID